MIAPDALADQMVDVGGKFFQRLVGFGRFQAQDRRPGQERRQPVAVQRRDPFVDDHMQRPVARRKGGQSAAGIISEQNVVRALVGLDRERVRHW